MKIITATLVDATHGELSQPLVVPPDASLQIAIPKAGDAEHLWRAGSRHTDPALAHRLCLAAPHPVRRRRPGEHATLDNVLDKGQVTQ